jgi:A/G-specific adenine glycosylase
MPVDAATVLLAWYDVHGRSLPWRAPPGQPPADPYHVWLSEIMLQQTTVAAVRPYFIKFTALWPRIADLAAAPEEDVLAAWAGLGYYARARNLIACARQVAERGGFPTEEDALRELPGIGSYTAAAIAAIAFDRPAAVVDGNVERVVARLFAIEEPLPAAKPQLRRLTATLTPRLRAGDFAQAMMDLGATICTPRTPACAICPLRERCAAAKAGLAETLPRKLAKKRRPQRYGSAFWLERGGHVMLVRRPARGLLGGMRALPSGPWSETDPGLAEAPVATDWRELGTVEHVFTHFALSLRILAAEGDAATDGEWWPIDRIDEAGLPSLFARAVALASRARPRYVRAA